MEIRAGCSATWANGAKLRPRTQLKPGAPVQLHMAGSPIGSTGSWDADHHHLRNVNDVVTHAWQVDELEEIPSLYAPRAPGSSGWSGSWWRRRGRSATGRPGAA